MARKKHTAVTLPPNSGFKASASFLMARGHGPSEAASAEPATSAEPGATAKPVAMSEEPHMEFVPVYIHTAKCDMCEKRNYSVLHRCVTCTSQFCYRCMLGGDGIHRMSIDMNWEDYGAQANSNPILKSQRMAKEYVSRDRPLNVFRQRYTSAEDIPSCRYHHRELKNAREETMEAFVADETPARAGPAAKRQKTATNQQQNPGRFVADEIPAKAGPAPKRQKTVTNQQSNTGRPAPAAMKNTRAENAKKNRTEAQFPLIIPSHEDDYGPKFQSFISNIRDMTDTDDDMTIGESTSSDDDDHNTGRISGVLAGPTRVFGWKQSSARPAPNPYAKEIKEHQKDITGELSLIEKHLDLIKDKKRLALLRKTQIDEALDAACILMSMRTDSRGFPAEKETSALANGSLAKEGKRNGALGSVHTLGCMKTGVRVIPADRRDVSKDTMANVRPFVMDSQARAFGNDGAVGAPASAGIPEYSGVYHADRRSHLTETGRLALEKERKVDAVVEAAYYSLMREGRPFQLRPRETRM